MFTEEIGKLEAEHKQMLGELSDIDKRHVELLIQSKYTKAILEYKRALHTLDNDIYILAGETRHDTGGYHQSFPSSHIYLPSTTTTYKYGRINKRHPVEIKTIDEPVSISKDHIDIDAIKNGDFESVRKTVKKDNVFVRVTNLTRAVRNVESDASDRKFHFSKENDKDINITKMCYAEQDKETGLFIGYSIFDENAKYTFTTLDLIDKMMER